MKMQTLPLLLALAAAPPLALAQANPTPHQHPPAAQTGEQPAKMDCEAMMARHREMQERMAAADAELDRLVAAMRSASGAAKTEATAAVVEKLVEQRKAMHSTMMQHHHGMMQHMMGHMEKGEGAASCPMMKQMGHGEGHHGGSEDSGHGHG